MDFVIESCPFITPFGTSSDTEQMEEGMKLAKSLDAILSAMLPVVIFQISICSTSSLLSVRKCLAVDKSTAEVIQEGRLVNFSVKFKRGK